MKCKSLLLSSMLPLALVACVKSDDEYRDFPRFVSSPLVEQCQVPKDEQRKEGEYIGPQSATGTTMAEKLSFKPFHRMLCASRVLQDRYVRRHRRSVKAGQVMDGAAFGLGVSAIGLATFGAATPLIAGAGLGGGAVSVGRTYKSPDQRQRIYVHGEHALACMDDVIRRNDAVFHYMYEDPAPDFVATHAQKLDQLELLARLVLGAPDTDEDVERLKPAAEDVLRLVEAMHKGPGRIERAYRTIGESMAARYQDSRRPIAFGETLNVVLKAVGDAKASKASAEAKIATIVDQKKSDGNGKEEKTKKESNSQTQSAIVGNWRSALRANDWLAGDNGIAVDSFEDIRWIFLSFLSRRYDTVRDIEADVTICTSLPALTN